jgi:membrane fusion protein, heavy metal efflux system
MGFVHSSARRPLAITTVAAIAVGALAVWLLNARVAIGPPTAQAADKASAPAPNAPAAPSGPPVLALNDKQLALVKIGPVGEQTFPQQKEAVGSIDFNEDMSVQVFSNYQGKLVSIFAKVGDEVEKGKPLFTIDSPDLVQAESTLISAAGVLELTTKALARARKLYATQGTGGIAEKDLEQAVSDQQSAEGALHAARDAVRVFGKTEDEIKKIIASRHIDPILVVNSPISGKITARNAQPGLLVQPGTPPAPFTMADISTMWMLANVPEIDSPAIKIGEEVKVSTLAYPGQLFEGKITTLAAAVDPSLHTLLVRSEIQDPQHQLRPGMFANFVIRTGDPITAVAAPLAAVVREGDGTMTVWVTTDRRRFTQRAVKVGLQRGGYDQITEGLSQNELIVTDGAVFLDNMLTAPATD